MLPSPVCEDKGNLGIPFQELGIAFGGCDGHVVLIFYVLRALLFEVDKDLAPTFLLLI